MDTSEQFERDKICYQQNFEQMRSLNQIMWQVPIIAMTLTGGLWYAVGTFSATSSDVGISLLIFSGIANVGLILMINRVRDVIGCHLKKLREFNPSGFVDASPSSDKFVLFRDRGVCRTFSCLMGLAALASFAAAFVMWCGLWDPTMLAK